MNDYHPQKMRHVVDEAADKQSNPSIVVVGDLILKKTSLNIENTRPPYRTNGAR